MTLNGCSREKEVRELVDRGQWPVASEIAPDLRAHVDGGRACGDLVLVAEAFRQARAQSLATARLGSAGALWWRAQLRRRNATIERLARPLLGAQIFAIVTTVLAGAGFLGFAARPTGGWLSWLEQLPQDTALHLDSLLAAMAADPSWRLMVLLPALATLALVGGLAVYMAADRQ